MTTFFTVMENDSNKDVPAVAVFEAVGNRRAAERYANTLNRNNPGKYTISNHKVRD